MLTKIILHANKEKSLLRHHPWVFSRAIDKIEGTAQAGDIVQVYDHKHIYLATGVYNPKSQISIRVLSFEQEQKLDYNFIKNKLIQAQAKRKFLIDQGNNGYRLVASEGDFMPGLIIDVFNNYLVISISSYAMEIFYEDIIKALSELYSSYNIYERSDTSSRQKEGLAPRCGIIKGNAPVSPMYVLENNSVEIAVDIENGHKTGGYLDQRHSRHYLMHLCQNKHVLNCFSYTGGFGLYALKGKALSVTNVDVSKHALDLAKKAVAHNHLDPGRCKFLAQDVFNFLREEVAKDHKYDVIILDPPKFIKGAMDLKKGCRGYQDINRLAFMLLNQGGHLLTFSCSGLMDINLFQKIVFDASLEAKVNAQLVTTLHQDQDHLVALNCPESFYLKGLHVTI